VSPTGVQANAPATLTIQAVDVYVFADGSRKSGVQIDGTMLDPSQVTVAISPSQPDHGTVTAQVPAALLGPGQHAVRLVNPTDAGPVLGGQAAITATATGKPQITALSPASAAVGRDALQVLVSGTGFANGSAVQVGAQRLAATLAGNGQLVVSFPEGVFQTVGSLSITVVNPDGSASGPASFNVLAPVLQSVTPRTLAANQTAFLTIQAADVYVFANGSRATQVQFGGTLLPASVDPVAGRISVSVPAGLVTPGTHSLALVNPTDSGSVRSAALSLGTTTAGVPPALSSLSPSTLVAGTTTAVTALGSNLPAQAASFSVLDASGQPAAGIQVTSATTSPDLTQSSLQISVGSGVAAGTYSLRATNAAGTAQIAFTVSAATSTRPVIGAVQPSQIPAGATSTVVVSGQNLPTLASAYSVLTASGQTAGIQVASAAGTPTRVTLAISVPSATAAGSYLLRARTAAGTAQATLTLTVGTRPAITALSPSSGPVGIDVVISGQNLAGATAVRFGNGQLADFSVDAAGTITAEVPDAATSGLVTVVTPAGSAASPVAFGVTVATNPPTIQDLQPRQGSVGDRVKITGVNLTDVKAVRFGVIPNVSRGLTASFSNPSSTEIDAVVPDGAVTGLVRVKTRTQGKGDSPFPFTVVPKLGTLDAFGPSIGVLGDSVELTGQGLGRAVGVNFGGLAAPFLINSDQSITAYVPIKNTLSDQTVRIDVVVPDGSFGKDGFTVQKTPVTGIFQITGFDPDRAAPGGTVQLFGALENPADVEFGGVPGQITFFRPDGLGLSARVPPNAVDGPISVRQNFGTVAESVGDFIVNGTDGLPADGQPAIDSFTPRLGGPGTPVTIHGVNLAGNVDQVQFGGIRTGFSFDAQDRNTLHVTVPGRAPGPAYITIMPSTNGVPVTSARPFIVS
jgi:IPT/TIG domain